MLYGFLSVVVFVDIDIKFQWIFSRYLEIVKGTTLDNLLEKGFKDSRHSQQGGTGLFWKSPI